MSAPAPRPSPAAAWWLALRPKTLSVAASPVLAGASLAWQEHQRFFLLPFLVTLICSLLIQAATNLYNDAADFERGADTPDRLPSLNSGRPPLWRRALEQYDAGPKVGTGAGTYRFTHYNSMLIIFRPALEYLVC